MCINWTDISILWYALDAVLFLAAMGAYSIGQAEKRKWLKKRWGERK